jgi:hypothetical protein
LQSAVQAHEEYITGETLAVALQYEAPPEEAVRSEDQFDGEKAVFGFTVAA